MNPKIVNRIPNFVHRNGIGDRLDQFAIPGEEFRVAHRPENGERVAGSATPEDNRHKFLGPAIVLGTEGGGKSQGPWRSGGLSLSLRDHLSTQHDFGIRVHTRPREPPGGGG